MRSALAVVSGSIVVGLGSPSGAAASAGSQGVTGDSITIGFVTSQTGPAAPTFSDSAGGATARFALQNARGGVDGRKLKLTVEDDQSSPTQSADVASLLVSDNVFGVIEDSAINGDYASGNSIFSKAGIPEVGWPDAIDANSFNYTGPNIPLSGTVQGKYAVYDYLGPFLKSIGVTKLAGVTYSVIENDVTTIMAVVKHQGISNCYEDFAPVGSTNFTVQALAIHHQGCNGVNSPMVDSSDAALSGALKNEGSTAKQVYETGYDQTVLSDPSAASELDGDYMASSIDMTDPNAGTKAMLAAIKKYDPDYRGGLPDLGTYDAYIAAGIMIDGLQLAGRQP
ncbi:MAG TPA: ABC transporter substrate-binding protein, partial [Acidimicrobiales bacterium]